jgi:hydroxymethylbilane synthase
MGKKIVIGTRGSDLALWQANYTKNLLEEKGHEVELKIITTSGDKSQEWNTAFDKLEGKGFFTKELEEELLAGTIDVAVHSHKDLPTASPEGLMIAGVSKRADPSDILLIREDAVDDTKKFFLKEKAKVGTSSARRKSQLLAFRPDVELQDLRGNVPTRVKKLKDGEYDAILIATAGVERLDLDLDDFRVEKLPTSEFVPAPAQGVLAWQIKEDRDDLLDVFDPISDLDVLVAINVERRVLNLLDGGCSLPLGAYCETENDENDRLKFRTWISIAEKWDSQPKQLFFESYLGGDLPERIVEKITSIKPRSIFISRDLREKDYLKRALTNLNFKLEAKSLIEFKQIAIREIPKTDWIFFSSKHAVKFFFNQKPKIEGVKIGCVGKSTAQELRAFGLRAQFIGQNTDTKLIGKQFASIAGSSKVLFPIAKESMQTAQNQILKKENVFNMPIYWTVKHGIEVDTTTEILVLTSPSNVDAFFEKNTWQPHYKVVAMGDATALALAKKKVKDVVTPISFDDLGLFQAILQLS